MPLPAHERARGPILAYHLSPPVIVRNPRLDILLKKGLPGAGPSNSCDSSCALWEEPTDRMRLATSPCCAQASKPGSQAVRPARSSWSGRPQHLGVGCHQMAHGVLLPMLCEGGVSLHCALASTGQATLERGLNALRTCTKGPRG